MSDAIPSRSASENVDVVIAARMVEHRIPGISLTVIDEGRIVKAQGYGFMDRNGNTPITAETLFQAASISKPVTAVAALRLVEQGLLDLDEDVNHRLRTWKVPENEFTAENKVTLRRILSHHAGLTIHGFAGYELGQPVPTLAQILDGASPANNSPIRVGIRPNSMMRYSGGGYVVLQQLLMDVTGQSFPELMRELVLQPFGITASTFEQPLPKRLTPVAACGHRDGNEITGRWHTYPEMAAAGLWSTASDLARFAIGIQQSLAGKANSVISSAMTREMLTSHGDGLGLGFYLANNGKAQRFFHSGRNAGFDALMLAFAETGKGVVLMFNANIDPKTANIILQAITKEYRWNAVA